MLVHLDIRDFAIVDAVTLELDAGLTVLTGETGAGKSILIDAIGMLLGDRADSASVREGVAQAEIIGQWQVDPESAPAQWLHEQALADADDDTAITLRRVVGADGRSRAFVNGRATPIA